MGQDQLMQELDVLRIRGEYPELARRISSVLLQVTSPTVRKSLSYDGVIFLPCGWKTPEVHARVLPSI